MIKKLDYLIINYTDKDKDYIDYILDTIEPKTKEIVIDNPIKTEVTLYDDLDIFRDDYKKLTKRGPDDWIYGLSYNNKINTLSLDESKKLYEKALNK